MSPADNFSATLAVSFLPSVSYTHLILFRSGKGVNREDIAIALAAIDVHIKGLAFRGKGVAIHDPADAPAFVLPAASAQLEALYVDKLFHNGVHPRLLIDRASHGPALHLHVDVRGAVAHLQPCFIDHAEGDLFPVLPVEKLEGKALIAKPQEDGTGGAVAPEGPDGSFNFLPGAVVPLGEGCLLYTSRCV